MKKQAITRQSQMMIMLCVHHKTVSALLQEIRRSDGHFVRLASLEREILGHRVWGVLLTASLHGEIHIVWVKVQEARFYTPALHAEARAVQGTVYQCIRRLAIQAGLAVQDDSWYAVVPTILLYSEPAIWPEEQERN